MEDFTIAIYCFVDDFLKVGHRKAGGRRKLTDAQIITTALVAAKEFSCNFAKAKSYLRQVHGFDFPHKSNFNRHLHRLHQTIVRLFHALARVLMQINTSSSYIIDSFPVSVCRNIRIKHCKLLNNKAYRGFNASKREYFYGFKVQVVTTADGLPVEVFICAGSYHDVLAFQSMHLDLPQGSQLYGDSGYTKYELEDLFWETEKITLLIERKKDAKKKDSPAWYFLKKNMRRRIETTFSEINKLFPRKIHAVTAKGFMLKIFLFIFAFTASKCY